MEKRSSLNLMIEVLLNANISMHGNKRLHYMSLIKKVPILFCSFFKIILNDLLTLQFGKIQSQPMLNLMKQKITKTAKTSMTDKAKSWFQRQTLK